jgi:hypothetical protein
VNKSTRQRLFFLGRLALGMALLTALLVVNDNGREVLHAFVQLQPMYLIPFFAITYPLLGASCQEMGAFPARARGRDRLPPTVSSLSGRVLLQQLLTQHGRR